MSRSSIVIAVVMTVFAACQHFTMDTNDYTYFQMVSSPEKRTYYPEENLVFGFNMPVNAQTVENIVVSYSDESECGAVVTASGSNVEISGFLPEKEIIITFKPGLKSTDGYPLVFLADGLPQKTTAVFSYLFGKGFPKLYSVLPGLDVISNSFVLRFDGDISVSQAEISPVPDEFTQSGNDILLYFNQRPAGLIISGATTTLRKGIIPDIILDFTKDTGTAGDILFTEAITDISYTISSSDPSLVAIKEGDIFQGCAGGCVFSKKDIMPDMDYNFEFTAYTVSGREIVTKSVHTPSSEPHIMITEVMHTPSKEPEKNWEFVELYNYGKMDFSLEGCQIDDKNDGAGVDPLLPKEEADFILKPGEFALILGNESTLYQDITNGAKVFFVNDSTIADGGLTSTKSVQIKCLIGEQTVTSAQYDGLFKAPKRGYSVTIDTDFNVCSSKNDGGSPGVIESCLNRGIK